MQRNDEGFRIRLVQVFHLVQIHASGEGLVSRPCEDHCPHISVLIQSVQLILQSKKYLSAQQVQWPSAIQFGDHHSVLFYHRSSILFRPSHSPKLILTYNTASDIAITQQFIWRQQK